MVNQLKTWLVVGLLVFLVGALTAQYNLYAVDKLNAAERSVLADHLEPGQLYRLGGEEYEHFIYTDESITDIRGFIDDVEGIVSLVAPGNYQGFERVYEALDATHVTYKNEVWFEFEDWKYIRADFWTFLFNKQGYYRKLAKKHVQEAKAFRDYMSSKGHDVEVIINVPLPQNNKYRWILDEIKKNWTGTVSIHVYGKPETNYLQKLNGWVAQIDFDRVIVGELAGVDLKRYPNLKNSIIMRDLYDGIMHILDTHGITEIYNFTLCYNRHMANWQNKPVYPKYFVTETVTDELYNVY